ncbi:MAG: alpha-ketoglutarate-dependent dioxygenase AlkB [Boseongicola sp.]
MPDLFQGASEAPIDLNGVKVYLGWLNRSQQESMILDLRQVAASAPFRRYETPGGRQMSVCMTAAGRVGWMTDRSGYRYSEHYEGNCSWPSIPASVMDVWRKVADTDRNADSCLINYYSEDAKMGLHQDKDEADFSWPVVSISLGDEALFRVGGQSRKDPTRSHWLRSGDVALLAGDTRLAYHGIDRIKFGSSDLLPDGGRINLTIRMAR